MKTNLKSLALLTLAVSYPCVAFAEMIGSRLPAAFTAQNAVAVFAVVSVGVILGFDYGRSARRLSAVSSKTAAVRRESHRLAA